MSDAQQPPGGQSGGQSGGPAGEPVGSVGEEAAKLFGALSAWAREQAQEQEQEQAGSPPGAAGSAASAREALAHGLHEVGEHLGSAGPDCRWCPVCQVIHVVRQTSPEVRAHLASAAGSLMQAAAGLMATTPPPSGRGPVEHIDLDDGPGDGTDPWDDHQQEDLRR